MREIKFRAYEIAKLMNGQIRKTMYSNENLITWGEIPSPMLKTGFRKEFSETLEWIWMQYTGLKDKNGKEIYEGDILQISGFLFDNSTPQHKFIFPHGYVWRVFWCNEHLMWGIDNDTIEELHDLADISQWDLNSEIIGNIYENPELIKANG